MLNDSILELLNIDWCKGNLLNGAILSSQKNNCKNVISEQIFNFWKELLLVIIIC